MPRFTPGELEVMKVLWKHGEMKPAEIQERFPREIKNPALRSYLTILWEKSAVSRRRIGKAFFYKAKVRKESVFRFMFREVAGLFGDGSAKAVVMKLIESEKLSSDDLRELQSFARKQQKQ